MILSLRYPTLLHISLPSNQLLSLCSFVALKYLFSTSTAIPHHPPIPSQTPFLGDRLQNGSPYAIRPLSDCPVCLSCPVCDVGVLWPNSWMDQDETWHAGRPHPGHIVLDWDQALPAPKGHSPQFLADVCCGQMAGWIKMQVGLGPVDFVLDGDPALPSPKRGQSLPIFGPCLLWPNGWMDQDGTWHGGRP